MPVAPLLTAFILEARTVIQECQWHNRLRLLYIKGENGYAKVPAALPFSENGYTEVPVALQFHIIYC